MRSALPGIAKKGLLPRGTVQAAAEGHVRLTLPGDGPWDLRLDVLEDALRLVRESYAWRAANEMKRAEPESIREGA